MPPSTPPRHHLPFHHQLLLFSATHRQPQPPPKGALFDQNTKRVRVVVLNHQDWSLFGGYNRWSNLVLGE
nr:hypothetical protein [Tanacetum cinerariifolium]